MRSRKVIIVFAIILPLLGVLSMIAWASNARKAAYDGAQLHSVVRAKQDIPSGTKTADLAQYVETVKVPNDVLPTGKDDDDNTLWLSSLADADNGTTDGVIPAGEILLNSRILTSEERAEAYNLQVGETEVTVKLDGSRGSSKSLRIGDKVTVYSSFRSDGAGPTRTVPIIYSAVVSRINGISDADSEEAKADQESGDPDVLITLALSPANAQKIIYAMEFGSIWFALESPETDLTNLGPTTIEDLEKAEIPEAETPDTSTTEEEPTTDGEEEVE